MSQVHTRVETPEGIFELKFSLMQAAAGLTESVKPTLLAKPREFWQTIAQLESAVITIGVVTVDLRYKGPVSQAVDTDIV